MNLDKNKIVVIGLIGLVVTFIVGYSLKLANKDETQEKELKQPAVPSIDEEQEQYSSKLEAVDDLKEVKQSTAPSMYDENLLDTTGLFVANKLEKDREHKVDSILRLGNIDYDTQNYRSKDTREFSIATAEPIKTVDLNYEPREFKAAHEAFFSSNTVVKDDLKKENKFTTPELKVVVAGKQKVKANSRIELKTAHNAIVENTIIPKNTIIYGFTTFKPNRVLIKISNINHQQVHLKAYDQLDGEEGIYIKNNFRADLERQVVDDVIQDINIPGVPQLGGIKQLFRRTNRNIKVTIKDQYQLILKPSK